MEWMPLQLSFQYSASRQTSAVAEGDLDHSRQAIHLVNTQCCKRHKHNCLFIMWWDTCSLTTDQQNKPPVTHRHTHACKHACKHACMHARMHAHTHTHTIILRLSGFCSGQPEWAGIRWNIHPLKPIMIISHPYLLPPSITIHGILPVQSTCLTVFLHNLSPSFLWSISWPGTLNSTSYSVHFFTQSLSSFCSICSYHRNLFCCNSEIMSSNPSLSLNSLLGTPSYSSMPHIQLTILISSRWSATSFPFLRARSHFHATYYFAHKCCTISLSLSMIYPYW